MAFTTAAAAMAVLMFTLAWLIGTAQERTVQAIKARAPRVRRWGGWILLGVGAWVVASAAFPDLFRAVFF